MSEHTQQKMVVKWFKMQYKEYRDCIIAIPNGSHLAGKGSQRYSQVNKLKAEGMKSGVSDLFIAVPTPDWNGLWLEMKDEGKTISSVSKEQLAHLNLMSEMAYSAHWAAGFDKAKAIIEDYMSQRP